MRLFDTKIFNPEVFGQYVDTIPDINRNELYKSEALRRDERLKRLFAPQTGSYKGTLPIFGIIDGDPVNYDGHTDITTSTPDTYSQQFIVVGRAKGFKEKDFSSDITGGVNFMSKIGSQVAGYWANIFQARLLSVLKGIFAMTGTGNVDFVNGHTYDASAIGDGTFTPTTLNTAVQKASGDAKSQFRVAIMHSKVATDCENLNVLEYLKYTDANGIQRDLTLATLNGRIVLIDDNMPVNNVYTLTTDTAIVPGKTYYTRSGSAGNYVYTPVANPVVGDIATYYELTATKYTTYVLGVGAITFEDVGAEVPYELERAALTNGGESVLVTRKRFIIAPTGISFVGNTVTDSPTDAELESGASWALISNGQTGSAKKFFPQKKIAISRIITQ
jgi:hypothetical protein